ncbi:MAG TPA: MBOAT family O-acyltransferase [Clostridia bacterium]|nr:MBOAT family O-acyltransferase [Clostridia bacterium]
MVFSSTEFLLLFLPLTLIIYFNPFFKGRKFRNYFLLLMSLGFYGWGEPLFLFVMIFSIFINWFFALQIDKQSDKAKRKRMLIPPIVFDILLMFLFKYLAFTAKNIGWLFNTDLRLDIALPIGISFFTFQIMSYVFDVYYRKARVQRNILNVGLYISLFPQLIAGPIVRYETVADEIMNRRETRADITHGVIRFTYGLGKKVLLANYTAVIADNIFALSGEMSIGTAWLGIIAYALQIYFDFSGYSDMAIGLGLIFGFHFEENFNFPYAAYSVTDFWRRWHISLSTWFRDYVYIPLGGNRVSKPRWALNLLVVWTLTGIWHGANWTFIAWGLYYFVFLLAEKLLGYVRKSTLLSRVYTVLVVLVGWVIFRSLSLDEAVRYIGVMFGIGAKGWSDNLFIYYYFGGKWVLIIAILFSLPVSACARKLLSKFTALTSDAKGYGNPASSSALAEVLQAVPLIIVFVLSLLASVNSSYNPFIYFNF